MPTTAFPAGVSSFGAPVSAGGLYDMPSGEVYFVCNRSGTFGGNGLSRDQPLTSLADAAVQIATTNPTKGAIIFVMAGHAETVTGSNIYGSSLVNTTAIAFPAGTRIIGEGFGGNRPTFTLTAAASTILLSTAGCSLENVIILCPQTGTTTAAAMVTVTGASCMIRSCTMQGAASATALATTGISVGTAAADLQILDNTGFTVTGAPTSWVSSASTAAPTRIFIQRNFVRWQLSAAAGGIVDMTGASVSGPTDMQIEENQFGQLHASSTVVMKFSATTSGMAKNNDLETIAGTAAAVAITTPGLLTMYDNRVAQQGKQSIACTVGGNSS